MHWVSWLMLFGMLALPALTAAGGRPWYVLFNDPAIGCDMAGDHNGPLDHIALADLYQRPYKMEDVVENGQVVETTMITAPTLLLPDGRMTWYRTRERCEMAKKRQQQEAARARQRLRNRYE